MEIEKIIIEDNKELLIKDINYLLELYLVFKMEYLIKNRKTDLIFLKDLLLRIQNYYKKTLYKFSDQSKLFRIFKENGLKNLLLMVIKYGMEHGQNLIIYKFLKICYLQILLTD